MHLNMKIIFNLLKKSCKNSRYPLQDTYNRIIEQVNIQTQCNLLKYPTLKNEINSGDSINENVYEKVILKNFVGSSKSIRDKYTGCNR